MPLSYHPQPGEIVICDYGTCSMPPEMVKVRPVVIISPRRRTSNLLTVVPLSSTAPTPVEPWHYELPPGAYPPARSTVWEKADVLSAVSLKRLDRVRIGQGQHRTFQLGKVELAAIYAAVKAGLGLS